MTYLTKLKPQRLYRLQILGGILGVSLSIYLLAQHTRLKSGIQGGASFCSFGKFADCDIVNSSQFSEIFGIPLASIGATYFFLLLLLCLLAGPRKSAFQFLQQWVAWISAAGVIADSMLFGVQAIAIQSFCLVCLGTYAANLLIFFGCLGFKETKPSKWGDLIKRALFPQKMVKTQLPSTLAVTLSAVALLCFLAVLVLLPDSLRLRSKTYSMVDSALTQFYATWKEKKVRNIDWKESDGRLGNPSSKIRIVEFSDFQCPFCKKAAFTLHNALDPIKNDIFFVFKQFPLDKTCNSSMPYQLHPHACNLARLAYCANKAGTFWEFHDHVFLKVDESVMEGDFEKVKAAILPVMSAEKIDLCLKNPESLKHVKEDIALGQSLEINGTPTVFINGKKITIPLTVETLRNLIALEASAP